jgi:hypothetical protein
MGVAELLTAASLFATTLGQPAASPVDDGRRHEYVRVTYYTITGTMANQQHTHIGAAACSRWLPLGTVLELPDGWRITCEDRGLGDRYWDGWIDIWAPSRAWGNTNVTAAYGDYTWVSLIEADEGEGDDGI